MPDHKPNYQAINDLERELFPEWFEGEAPESAPTPPPTPPPPPKRRRAPGREEPPPQPNLGLMPFAMSAVSPNDIQLLKNPYVQSRPVIYGPDGKPL